MPTNELSRDGYRDIGTGTEDWGTEDWGTEDWGIEQKPRKGDNDESITNLVNAQAEDEGLWFRAVTASEAYLQQALRELHARIEKEKGK